jgi:hypothetical protein
MRCWRAPGREWRRHQPNHPLPPGPHAHPNPLVHPGLSIPSESKGIREAEGQLPAAAPDNSGVRNLRINAIQNFGQDEDITVFILAVASL